MANILKVLKGPLSTFKKNRNGRIYTKELWENVMRSEYWKDMTANNTLCGEIVHPGDRTESDSFEIDARNISHRIKEAHIVGDKLLGTVEVLDTPAGRTLKDLIDAGCTVGISARGVGDLIGDIVNPDTYNFKCFDITMRPSDPNARLVPLTESEKLKTVLSESEISDRLIESPVGKVDFSDTSDLIKNTLTKRVYDNIASRGDEELGVVKKPGSLSFVRNKIKGNVFFVKADTDEDQPTKYLMFSNKGLKYTPIQINYDASGRPLLNEIDYKGLADIVFNHMMEVTNVDKEINYAESDDIEELPHYDEFIKFIKEHPGEMNYEEWYNKTHKEKNNTKGKIKFTKA